MGRREDSLLSDSGSALRLGREKEKDKCEDNKLEEKKKKNGVDVLGVVCTCNVALFFRVR